MAGRGRDHRRFFGFLRDARDFLAGEGFLECAVPPVVGHPGAGADVHPFELHSPLRRARTGRFLHTSPEFAMKSLLADGMDRIFTLGWSFRDEPPGPAHRPQFLMLEWYRRRAPYLDLARDCEGLVSALGGPRAPFERRTVDDLFEESLGVRPTDFPDKKDLRRLIERDFRDVPLGDGGGRGLEWDDLFFLLFLNRVEPGLRRFPFLVLHEYPAPLCALAAIKDGDPRVCERFELYAGGVEVANAFQELADPAEQRRRLAAEDARREGRHGYALPEARVLLDALERGIGGASGIALGVERLYAALTGDRPFWD